MSDVFGEGGSPQEIIRLQIQADGAEKAATDIENVAKSAEKLAFQQRQLAKAAAQSNKVVSQAEFTLNKWGKEADTAAVAAGRLAASQRSVTEAMGLSNSAIRTNTTSQWANNAAVRDAQISQARVAAATAGWSTALGEEEKAVARVTKRTWLMNQALFTARRFLFYGALGIVAIGVAGAKWGYDYAVNVQQATKSLSFFIKDQTKLHDAVQQIFTLAALTPFSFAQTLDAVRKFMILGGLGFTKALNISKDLADVLSAAGSMSNQTLQRANVQITHMLLMGRVTGQVLNALSRDNVPLVKALVEQYKLAGYNVAQLGRLGITSGQALFALHQYLVRRGLVGAAQKLTYASLPLLLTTFRDFFGKLAALAEKPIFTGVMGALTRMTVILEQANKIADKRGLAAAFNVIDKAAHTGGLFNKTLFNIGHALTNIWHIFTRGFLPALIIFMRVVGAVFQPLRLFAWITGVLSHHTTLLRIYMTLLITRFTVLHIQALLMVSVWKRLVFWKELSWIFTKREGEASKFATLWKLREKSATELLTLMETRLRKIRVINVFWTKLEAIWSSRAVRAFIAETIAMRGLNIVMWAAFAAQMAYNFALEANPIVLLVIAVVALGTALTILYFKWKPFHDIVNDTFSYIKKNWRWMQYLFPPIKMVVDVYEGIKLIYNLAKKIVDLIKHPLDWGKWLNITGLGSSKGGVASVLERYAKSVIPGYNVGSKLLKHLGVPGFHQHGGVVQPGENFSIVGERGPELLQLPSGSRITPLSHDSTYNTPVAPLGTQAQIVRQPIVIQVKLDKKKVAEAVSEVRLDKAAGL